MASSFRSCARASGARYDGGDRTPRVGRKAITEAIAGTSTINDFSIRTQHETGGVLDLRGMFALGAVALAFSGTFTHVFRHAI